jgi:hypothetical protein
MLPFVIDIGADINDLGELTGLANTMEYRLQTCSLLIKIFLNRIDVCQSTEYGSNPNEMGMSGNVVFGLAAGQRPLYVGKIRFMRILLVHSRSFSENEKITTQELTHQYESRADLRSAIKGC